MFYGNINTPFHDTNTLCEKFKNLPAGTTSSYRRSEDSDNPDGMSEDRTDIYCTPIL